MNADLVSFLQARLDDDERVARVAMTDSQHVHLGPVGPGGVPEYVQVEERTRWAERDAGEVFARFEAVVETGSSTVVRVACGGEPPARNVALHIARHDPARVLAEVEAKRALVAFLDPDGAPEGEGRYVAERALLLLAQPFADHPDFAAEWALTRAESDA